MMWRWLLVLLGFHICHNGAIGSQGKQNSKLVIPKEQVEQAVSDAVSYTDNNVTPWLVNDEVGESTRRALISEHATRYLVARQSLTPNDINGALRSLRTNHDCPKSTPKECVDIEYPTLSGECNNVEHPTWGSANSTFSRFLPPDYDDGVSLPRGFNKSALPSAKVAARVALRKAKFPGLYLTPLFSLWGDFVERDVSKVARQDTMFGETKCCWKSKPLHPECNPVYNNETKDKEERCQGYIRSRPALAQQCALGPREQLNTVSSFLDGSLLYGNTQESLDKIRTSRGRVLIPEGMVKFSQELLSCKGGHCLTKHLFSLLQLIFLKEHNRLAENLAVINPHWSEEKVFQETRRIVMAEIQHITFSEFIHVLMGETIIGDYDLRMEATGFFKDYDLDLQPGVSNVFASIGLGFLTSLFNEELGNMETAFLRGGTYLIHMGRDHGVPSYTRWREFCGLPVGSYMSDLNDYMSEEALRDLSSIYKKLSDVDLLVGGLLEKPLKGAVFGPTLTCILASQFKLLRQTNRFWYENNIPPSAFTKGQLMEIRKITLSGLLCNNMDNVPLIQPNAFLQNDPFLNAKVPCNILPQLSISQWQDSELPELILPSRLLEQSLDKAKMQLAERKLVERKLWINNRGAPRGSPEAKAHSFHAPNEHAVLLSNTSLVLEFASAEILNQINKEVKFPQGERKKRDLFDLDVEAVDSDLRIKRQTAQDFTQQFNSIQDFAQVLPRVNIRNLVQQPQIQPTQQCQRQEEGQPCDPKLVFRSYSGWCNNLEFPHFGKSLSPFNRLLASNYDDGVSVPRHKSVNGQFLPSPRHISTYIHADVSHPHSRYTLMLMQYGQFLDHDITLTPEAKGFPDSVLECRDCESAFRVHPECYPIPIPQNDPYYPTVNVSNGRPFCISFTRSLPGQQQLGPREQLNQNTAFLDASHLYGSNLCQAYALRTFFGGKLNVTRHPVRGKDLLPQSQRVKDCESDSGICFSAGDERPSEHPGLAAFHTVFMREHNTLASNLALINPHWDDEKLYQVVRKIMGASLQHITYNEFLPRVLGWNAIQLYELNLLPSGYSNAYDAKCNPSALNEFATAAFRFGHSLIKPVFHRMDTEFRQIQPDIRLRDHFNNPDKLYELNMVDEIMRGMVSTESENLDPFVTSEVTNHLFEHKNIPYSGLDLVSLNIQRGRDHGLRPYNDYRVICNLARANTFDDLSREISQVVIERLKQIYPTVNDIDLFTGGLVETPLEGGVVGPTFGCIIGLQFRFLKKCDRFWYETGDPVVRFTEAQLAEIRKVSLAKIVCRNCDIMDRIQRRSVDMPHDFLNPRVPCESLPDIDLRAWQEQILCTIAGNSVTVGQTALTSPCTQCSCTTEGAVCNSIRVTDCNALLQEVGADGVRNDNVCRAQCGHLLRTGRSTGFKLPFKLPFRLPVLG